MTKQKRIKAMNLLKARDVDGILSWIAVSRSAMRTLNAFTFDKDELLRWRAIEAIGRGAGQKAESNLPGVRDLIRRLLWSMTDESGATNWFAPEVIGEILANVPVLIKEFGILLGSYFEEEPFERGSRWAVARASRFETGPFVEFTDQLKESSEHEDPYIRGWSYLALINLGKMKNELNSKMSLDEETITFYDFTTGTLKTTSLNGLAEQNAVLINT